MVGAGFPGTMLLLEPRNHMEPCGNRSRVWSPLERTSSVFASEHNRFGVWGRFFGACKQNLRNTIKRCSFFRSFFGSFCKFVVEMLVAMFLHFPHLGVNLDRWNFPHPPPLPVHMLFSPGASVEMSRTRSTALRNHLQPGEGLFDWMLQVSWNLMVGPIHS